MKSKNRYKIATVSSIITILLMLAVYAVFSIFPFGSKTIAWCDLDQQTIPLLMDLKDILNGKGSIFYSTANCGGMNFWGIFLFFLASPFYVLTAFIPKADMIYFVNILLILKLAAASSSSALYFSTVHPKLTPAFGTLLSIMYAFCGFGLMYYQTLVWLDIMYLFPLLVIAVDKMCRTGRSVMYCIMLSLIITVNYYLSYMVIIYLIISVPLYIIIVCRKDMRKKISASFAVSSIAAALITSPVWLCSYLQVSASARGSNTFIAFLTDSFSKSISEKLCLLMCTALAAAMLPFFLKNKLCRKKIIRYKLILFLLLLIPVFIDPINKLWHTGSYQCFPLRYGYIIVLTMLSLTAHLLEYYHEINGKIKINKLTAAVICILIAGYGTAAVFILKNYKTELSHFVQTLHTSGEQFILMLILFLLSAVMYFSVLMMLRRKRLSTGFSALFFSLIFIIEASVNSFVYVGFASNDDTVFSNSLKAEGIIEKNGLYRTKAEKKYIHANMTGALGYNSLSHYTSLTPEKYMFAMKKLGYSSYWMEVSPNGGTILSDALLSVRYSIGSSFDFKSYQKNLGKNDAYTIAESSIVCPPGIINTNSPKNNSSLDFTDRAAVQEQLAKKILNADNIVQRYDYEVISGLVEYKNKKYNISSGDLANNVCLVKFSIDVKGKQQLYFDLFDNISNRITEDQYHAASVYVNGICINDNYPNQKSNGFLDLGEFTDETAEISVIINKDVSAASFGVFGIDINNLKNAIEKISAVEPKINGNKITLECEGKSDNYLYLSVPWDKGFTAYINNQKADLYRVNDAFCALKLKKGHNSIKMVYYPPGLKISLAFSAAGLILLILLKISRRIYSKQICRISGIAVTSLFLLVLTALYIITPVICILIKLF